MKNNIKEFKNEILYWSKRLYEKGMSPATSGNISTRFEDNFLMSASGVCLNDMTLEDIILIDKKANILKGEKKPTSEKNMHLGIYLERKDINAIIHCHCPVLTAFCVSGKDLGAILPDFALMYEKIQFVPYFCPSTKELADSVKEVFKKDNMAFLKNHGVIIGAKSLKEAYYGLECVQACAKTFLYAQILGGAKSLSKKSINEIKKIYVKK